MKILNIPFAVEGFGKGQGAKDAPAAICSALKNFFASEKGSVHSDPSIETLDIDLSNASATQELIISKVSEWQPHILLGGDHSITYGAVKGFVQNNPGAGFIVFDAHPDLVNKINPPTQEDYLITLIEEGILDPKRVILIGLRNWEKKELVFLRQHKIVHFTMDAILMKGWAEVITGVMESIRSWPACYVSIDIDICDPAYAPGTGWIEPGGITSRDLIFAVQRLALLPQVKCWDIVEVAPEKDVNEMTVQLAAKLVVEINSSHHNL